MVPDWGHLLPSGQLERVSIRFKVRGGFRRLSFICYIVVGLLGFNPLQGSRWFQTAGATECRGCCPFQSASRFAVVSDFLRFWIGQCR